MMNLDHMRNLLGNLSISMRNKSVRMNLSMDGREKTKVELNGSLRVQGINMQMGKKMWHHNRGSIWLDRDMSRNSNIEVRVLVSWSVLYVVKNILRDIFDRIKV